MNRLLATSALVLALLLAACGGSGSSASPSPTATATPTVGGSAGPAADLEALIPDEIGGIPLQKTSMTGDQFVDSGTSSQELETFLQGLGVSVTDVSIAIGLGLSADVGNAVAMFLFRAEGADTDRLVSGFKEAYDADNQQGLVWEPVSVGGKAVERTTNPQQPTQIIYLYARDDILYFLTTATEEQAAEALAALP